MAFDELMYPDKLKKSTLPNFPINGLCYTHFPIFHISGAYYGIVNILFPINTRLDKQFANDFIFKII